MGKISNQDRLKRSFRIVTAMVISLAWLVAWTPNANAAIITGRVLTLGNSLGGESATYTFTFTVPTTGTVIKSVAANICTTAEGTCTMPSGFVNSSSTLVSQPINLGDASGWSVNTATSGSLRLNKTGNSATPTGSQTIVFGSVTNPTANIDNFFARITTYSDDSWTTAIDYGTVSASIADEDTVTTDISEVLTFTLNTTAVNLGPLTADVTGTGTSTLSASTNAANGYSVTISGNTLQSGINSITALAAQTASSSGSSQFGINVVDNATPNVGANPSGGSGAGTNDYNDADLFRFVSGDSIASTAGPSNSTTFTVSYIANVATTTAIGDYSTTLTYIVTGNF